MALLAPQEPRKKHSQNPKTFNSVMLRRSPPMRFHRGDLVEVASAEEGFVGSYYEATVVTDLVRGEYIVQYRTLIKEDLSGPLREVVSAVEVRPRPPEVMAAVFRMYDVVDAFDNDGWWVGKITGRVGDKYYVFFETTGDEIAYAKDRIRVHQDWVNAKWVM